MARRRSEKEIQQVLEQYRGSALARYLRRSRSGEQGLIRVKVESAAGTKGRFCAGSGQRPADRKRVAVRRRGVGSPDPPCGKSVMFVSEDDHFTSAHTTFE